MTNTVLILATMGAVAAAPCVSGPADQTAPNASELVFSIASSQSFADSLTLHIEGMTCAGCVLAVRKVLTKLDGVREADVSYETKQAFVIFDSSKVTVEQMIAAVKTLGYTATVRTEIPDARSGDR